MDYKDYYKILGVERNATPEQIKKQYRLLARKYHPDVSKEPNCEEKFKEVHEAYDVLKDPEKRRTYDQFGTYHNQPGGSFKTPPGWEHQYSGDSFEGNSGAYSEFFENIFGFGADARSRRTRAKRGRDIHSKLEISLEEAYAGGQRIIQLQEPEMDEATGQVRVKTHSLQVKIPSGVTSGQQIRLARQGAKGIAGGKPGDLYLEIQLASHPIYTVKNRDIYMTLPVTPWEAALGAKVMAPTLGGSVELKIPHGSQTDTQLRLKGRGLPGKISGDQYVTLRIYTPAPQTQEQRECYEHMAKVMPFDPRSHL